MEDASVRFVAADNPSANELTIHILGAVAQAERKAISERTKSALAAAKARGVVLGNPRLSEARAVPQRRARAFAKGIYPRIQEARGAGASSLRQIAAWLNSRAIRTARKSDWTAGAVNRVLAVCE